MRSVLARQMSTSARVDARQLLPSTINQNVIAARYAVRGTVVTRALEHE